MQQPTSFSCSFPAQTFPVGRTGHWFQTPFGTKRPTQLRCVPSLSADWEDPDCAWIDVDMGFDEADWDTEVLGLVYTNPEFEEAVAAWWATTVFGDLLPAPTYTEQGMQGEAHISMETRFPKTAHERLALLARFRAMEDGTIPLPSAEPALAEG